MKKNDRIHNLKKHKEPLDANKQWEAELIQRIDEIEETVESIQIMTKQDYIVAGLITLACLLFVLAGALLC